MGTAGNVLRLVGADRVRHHHVYVCCLGHPDIVGFVTMAALRTISFDGVIVGGGGAGMRAALQLAQSGFKTAVISKVFPDSLPHCIRTGRHHLRNRLGRSQ